MVEGNKHTHTPSMYENYCRIIDFFNPPKDQKYHHRVIFSCFCFKELIVHLSFFCFVLLFFFGCLFVFLTRHLRTFADSCHNFFIQ